MQQSVHTAYDLDSLGTNTEAFSQALASQQSRPFQRTPVPVSRPTAPFIGEAPSAVNERFSETPVPPAATTPSPAALPPSATPATAHPVSGGTNALLWIKHVFVGSGMAFMERLPHVLQPVAFVFNHLASIVLGLFYLAVPALIGMYLLQHSAALRAEFLVPGLLGVAYLVLLYVFCAVATILLLFTLQTFASGVARTLQSFARKGEQALPR